MITGLLLAAIVPAMGRAQAQEARSTAAVEFEALGAMSIVANASEVGPRYAGDPGIGVGGRLGVVLRRRVALAFLGFAFPPSEPNWSMSGTSGDRDRVGSYQLELQAGYDARFRRFHLRPTLGLGYVHDVYRHTWWTSTQTERLRIVSHGVAVVPGLSGLLDVHRHIFLSATLRFPVAFRVGEGDAFESLGDRDYLMSFTFGFGGRFP